MEGKRYTLAIGICDSMSAVACQIASVDAGGNRPKAVSCSDGVLLGGDKNYLPVLATALPTSFIVPDEGCECVCHDARSALTGLYDTLFHRVFKIYRPSEIPLPRSCHVVKPHGRSLRLSFQAEGLAFKEMVSAISSVEGKTGNIVSRQQ